MRTTEQTSALRPEATADRPPAAERTGRGWLWAGLATGVLGVASTMGAVLGSAEPADYDRGSQAVLDRMEGTATMHIGASLAAVTAVLLLPFALGLVRHLRAVQPAGSSYADVVRLALHALVAGLFLTVSLRYVALGGMPGGIDADFYTATDSTALAMLGSQMQFAGWLPGLVVTGVVAHASLRRRLFARWVGALLALLTLASAGATLALGLPYSSG